MESQNPLFNIVNFNEEIAKRTNKTLNSKINYDYPESTSDFTVLNITTSPASEGGVAKKSVKNPF